MVVTRRLLISGAWRCRMCPVHPAHLVRAELRRGWITTRILARRTAHHLSIRSLGQYRDLGVRRRRLAFLQLTSFGRGHSGTPRWSPDGSRIAFDSNIEGEFEIYTIAVNGGTPKRLTKMAESNVIPSWSRDSQWIYFASRPWSQL
jgi:WD40-like Beta Propeller Repeat